jgi:hypothetical protein
VGEALLVLGHQLAEFEEDKDRPDILALDHSGGDHASPPDRVGRWN